VVTTIAEIRQEKIKKINLGVLPMTQGKKTENSFTLRALRVNYFGD
jgi:hypothetical protein